MNPLNALHKHPAPVADCVYCERDALRAERDALDAAATGLGNTVQSLAAERDALWEALESIQNFGFTNPGCGHSCATLAKAALTRASAQPDAHREKP